MELRLVEALILFLNTATLALTLWIRSRVEQVKSEVNGQTSRLLKLTRTAGIAEGKEIERTAPNNPDGPV